MTEEKKRVSAVTAAIIGDGEPIGALKYRFDPVNNIAVIYVKVDHTTWESVARLSEEQKQTMRELGVDPTTLEAMTIKVLPSTK